MLKLCAKCGLPLKEGDQVKLVVYALYRSLKSKVAYCIDKPYDADQDTLQHVDCHVF